MTSCLNSQASAVRRWRVAEGGGGGGCADAAGGGCADWAASGECEHNTKFMLPNCARACETCWLAPVAAAEVAAAKGFAADVDASVEAAVETEERVRAGDCINTETACADWAAKGECTRNAGYMLPACCAACSGGTGAGAGADTDAGSSANSGQALLLRGGSSESGGSGLGEGLEPDEARAAAWYAQREHESYAADDSRDATYVNLDEKALTLAQAELYNAVNAADTGADVAAIREPDTAATSLPHAAIRLTLGSSPALDIAGGCAALAAAALVGAARSGAFRGRRRRAVLVKRS